VSALAHGSRRDEGDLIAGRGRGVPRAWLGLIVVALVLGALAAAASVLERGDGSPVASSRARSAPATARLGLASLPAAAQGPVSAALGRDDPAYRVRARAGALRAANPAQHLRATFARDGVLVADGAARVGLSLLTRGSGHSLQRLPAAAPALTGGRVEYRHGPVSEWWTNGPLGLEQTFEESAPTATEPVTLALAVSGNMHARLANGAVLLHRAGVSLRYAGLRATDARGKRLPAWLSLNGRTILIKVDARGARYPVRIDPFVQDAELSEASGANGDSFGTSVAIDGDTAVVGAPLYGTGGAAFVFVEGTSGWPATPTATLTYPGTRQGDGFGSAVAISGTVGSDGKLTDGRIVVGAPFAGSDTGAAYLFDEPQSQTWVNNGNNYVILQPPSNGVPINPQKPTPEFGAAVATAGTTAFVGMAGEELINVYTVPFPSYGGEVAGAEITGGGVGLAVSPDGTTLAAGYPNGPSGADPGLVNVYTEPQGGWSTVDLSTPAAATLQNVTDGSYDKTDNDLFGASVAVSDANVVVVGAPNAPEPGTSPGPGAAYIFTPSTGSWATDNGATESQVATLTAGSGLANDQLGASVGISSNGDTVVVGAPGVDNTSPTTTGHVYDFTKQGTTWTSLSNPDEPTVPTGARLGDMFGSSVGITGDGTSILAGDENSGGPGVIAGEGSAYVFESPVPHNTSLPTITVDGPEPNPGVKLGCNAGAWSNGPISGYTYQWNRNGAPISGETNALYTIQPGDVGVPLTCTVTASNNSGAGPAADDHDVHDDDGGTSTAATADSHVHDLAGHRSVAVTADDHVLGRRSRPVRHVLLGLRRHGSDAWLCQLSLQRADGWGHRHLRVSRSADRADRRQLELPVPAGAPDPQRWRARPRLGAQLPGADEPVGRVRRSGAGDRARVSASHLSAAERRRHAGPTAELQLHGSA
jgi:hypothetical protein